VLNDQGAIGVRDIQAGGREQFGEKWIELFWVLVGPKGEASGAPNEFKRLCECLDNVHAIKAIP
jgi:hypothetical protein